MVYPHAKFEFSTASMAKRFTRVPRVREVESSNPKRPAKLQTVTAVSTSTQIVVLPWRYNTEEMGTANSLHASV